LKISRRNIRSRPSVPVGTNFLLIGFVVSEILAISYVALLAVHNGPYGNFGVAHALYHVTLSRGVQNNHSYEIFDPYLPIHYATFMRLR